MKKLKGVFVGDFNAGKTSLVTRLFDNVFKPSQSTIGVEFRSGILLSEWHVSVWDTAGSEHYRSIVPMYFRNVDFICIVLDNTDTNMPETYDYWLTMIDHHANPDTPVATLINKYDLPTGSTHDLHHVNPTVEPIFVSAKCDTNTALMQKLVPFLNNIVPRPRRPVAMIQKPRDTIYSCC